MSHKILVVRLSSLGDIVHTYPMIYDIKAEYADCQLSWLVDESFVELVKQNQLVDNVIAIPLRKWKMNKLAILGNLFNWCKNNKNKSFMHYDYIIDAQGLLKSAIIARSFKGTLYGYGKHCIREKLATLFYNRSYEVGTSNLAISKSRLLAQKIFGYNVDYSKANFGLNSANFHPIAGYDNYIVLFHATSRDSKKYPQDGWVELANLIVRHYKLRVVLPYGNDREQQESEELAQLIDSNYAIVPKQKFNFMELHQLIANAHFIIGVDTGLIHLANALMKKVIALYTDTDPKKTGLFESEIAKNLGNIGEIPPPSQVFATFERIYLI